MEENDGDFFIPMFFSLIIAFFTTFPFVSEKEYVKKLVYNFGKAMEEIL